MDQFLTKLAEQVAAIRAAPYPFVLAVAIVAGAIWFIVNYAYRTILSSKNAQLELADRQLAEYKQKLSVASPDEARSKIDSLIAEITALRAKLEGRRLTSEQREKIVEFGRLSAGNSFKIQINRDMGASDGGAYADDFMNAFRVAGWQVSYGSILFGAPAPSGLAVFVKDLNSPSSAETIVLESLKRAQMKFDTIQNAPAQGGADASIWITGR
jgi:hypothetical protein